jgi:predicted thioesterase
MGAQGIVPGLSAEASQMVTLDRTAAHVGSGSLRVFATPAMVLMIEEVCRKMVEPYLEAGQSTVGVSLKVRHLAPTPVGLNVRVRAEVAAFEDGVITFTAEAWDEVEKIGEAEHKRAVIEVDRFLQRVRRKAVGAAG